QSVWAEPLLGKREALSGLHPKLNEEWLEATIGFVQALVEQFHPNIPVAGPFLRGPADVVPAMIGTDRFCYELIDHPGEIERLLQFCAQTWVDVYQQVIELIPEWKDGYVPGARWIFAPGECVYSSEDATGLISPKMYHRFVLPVNQFMASHFPYGYIHRHSDSIQHIDMLLEMPQGWAIEVTIDPVGPSIDEIMPIFKRIQESDRALIIFGLDDPLKINEICAGLSPKGLCIIAHADSPGLANALAGAVKGGNSSALKDY
ncbi:MAG: hypothetical protein MUO76_08755, partial [Anaerolineaceae bacterium]|nr:hypothetical protein [Anaerolineaceae bacterium]